MDKLYGQIGYEAYAKAVGGKAWNGEPLKTYDELPEHIRQAWVVQANVIIGKYIDRTENHD